MEFLEDKIQRYSFAEKLINFCLDHAKNPSWDEFSKRSQFQIPLSSAALRVCHIIFEERYARLWIAIRSGVKTDEAVKILRGIFGQDAEITPQNDDKAIVFIVRSEDDCDALLTWLSEGNASPPARDLVRSAISKEDRKKKFQAYMFRNNKSGSGKATSYLRAMDLLCEMLEALPKGFDDCRDIWSVDSMKRLEALSDLVKSENNLGPKSEWNLPGIPPSYLQKGYCSAALAAYIAFLDRPVEQDFSYHSKMFCQIALFWLLDQRESLIEENGLDRTWHPFLFSGDGITSRWCWKGNQDLDELNLEENFAGGFCRASHHLRSISRFAPEIANFVSFLAFPEDDITKLTDSFQKALESFNLCLDAMKGKHISRDLAEIIEDVSLDAETSGGETKKTEERIPRQVFEFMATSIRETKRMENPAIYDPSCGYGSLLLCAFDTLNENGTCDLLEFSGSEPDPDKASLCKIGFMLRAYALMRDGKLDAADFSRFIFLVVPNVRIEDSLNQHQEILKNVRNRFFHDAQRHCLEHEGKFDCILSAPQHGSKAVDMGGLAMSANQQFLLLSRLLLRPKGEALLLLPESFTVSIRDQEFRGFMLQFFAPRSITFFGEVVPGGKDLDKVLVGLAGVDRETGEGEIDFRYSSVLASPTRKMDELFNTKRSSPITVNEVVKKESNRCSVQALAANASKFIPRKEKEEQEKAEVVRKFNEEEIDFGKAAQFWKAKIGKISRILDMSSKLSRMLEDERSYHPTQAIGELEEKEWLRMKTVPGSELDLEPQALMNFMDLEGLLNAKGCAYFEIRESRIDLKWLSSEPRRFDSFISRLAQRHRFTQKSCFLFLNSSNGELDPLFFFYWLRTSFVLFLKSELMDEDPQFDGEGFERSNYMARYFSHKLRKIEISLPRLAAQADMVPVLRDIFSEIPFSASLRTFSRDRPSEIDMLVHLLRI